MPLVILVTLPPDRASDLARVLVEERLAGCVNIVPQMTTVYRWQGDVVVDGEALLIIKTEDDQYEALERRVAELHPYDVPEIVALPVGRALPSYLSWLQDSVRS
jgi:periplasmic divalent cation tolerance protein